MEDVVEIASTGNASDNDDVAVDDTVGGTPLLPANPSRKSALIINTGSEVMRVTTDGSDPEIAHGKLVLAGGTLSLSSPYCPSGEIKAWSEVGTTANASEVT